MPCGDLDIAARSLPPACPHQDSHSLAAATASHESSPLVARDSRRGSASHETKPPRSSGCASGHSDSVRELLPDTRSSSCVVRRANSSVFPAPRTAAFGPAAPSRSLPASPVGSASAGESSSQPREASAEISPVERSLFNFVRFVVSLAVPPEVLLQATAALSPSAAASRPPSRVSPASAGSQAAEEPVRFSSWCCNSPQDACSSASGAEPREERPALSPGPPGGVAECVSSFFSFERSCCGDSTVVESSASCPPRGRDHLCALSSVMSSLFSPSSSACAGQEGESAERKPADSLFLPSGGRARGSREGAIDGEQRDARGRG
ncbi:hypothetical protein BESB_005560 [Besnoitia besnoiti]|uniref:Uncharacterized protein n=1 Tax=Besnoitia besnoiti TaxID=94643 RepID=A0A2A9MJS0_BESBE|nr:hypothetical protein BESB_005560 [Besnoitia besnoiti]PFH38215.1 hypothetical protein BESB_005560 [Besnoitia besnoiti]